MLWNPILAVVKFVLTIYSNNEENYCYTGSNNSINRSEIRLNQTSNNMESDTNSTSIPDPKVETALSSSPTNQPISTNRKSEKSVDKGVNTSRRSILVNHVDDNDMYYVHPIAGYVLRNNAQYKCQWQNYHGSIIAGSTAIVFKGSFFLFEKTFTLHWDNIRQVVLMDSYSIDNNDRINQSGNIDYSDNNNNGIEIIMSDETVHSFVMNQIQQGTTMDKIWLSLLSLHNDALLGRQHMQTPRSNKKNNDMYHTPRNFERRNSDPESQGKTVNSILSSSPLNDDEHVDDTELTMISNDSDEFPNRPLIHTITSMSDQISMEKIMQHAGTPLRLQPIHCTYNVNTPSTSLLPGRLYIGNQTLFFTGKKYYFWEHLTLSIPWTTVQRIQLLESNQIKHVDTTNKKEENNPANKALTDTKTTNSNPNGCIGLRIITKDVTIRTDGGTIDRDGKVFDFCDMESPDKVWASLIAIQNEKLLMKQQLTSTSSSTTTSHLQKGSMTTAQHRSSIINRRKSHRRTNSDPMLASQLNFEYQIDDIVKDDEEADSNDISIKNITDDKILSGAPKEGKTPDSTITYSEAWLSMKNNLTTAKVYNNLVIEKQEVQNCTLNQFYDSFIADSALYSMNRFLEERGDYELQSSLWENVTTSEDDAKSVSPIPTKHKRVVKYMHPVNVPLAPPQAAARKEQVLYRYGDVGIQIDTQTFVDDVPMTDCFYVTDRILIEPSENGVIIRMEFGIIFVKSTMFKGIISKKTTAEFVVLFQALAQYISNALVDTNIPIVLEENIEVDMVGGTKQVTDTHTTTIDTVRGQSIHTSTTFSGFSIERIILLFVVLIQLWIVLELRGLKYAILTLDHHRNNVVFDNGKYVPEESEL